MTRSSTALAMLAVFGLALSASSGSVLSSAHAQAPAATATPRLVATDATPAPVLASASPLSAVSGFLVSVLHPVLLAVGSLLATALVGLVASVLKKNGIELTTAQHDFLTKIVNEGIDYAEEKAAAATTPGGPGPSGAQKHAMAVAYIQAKLPEVTTAAASDAIHANLPDSGSGATAIDPVSGRPA